MTQRQIIVAILGVLVIAVGLFADVAGLGHDGIGYKQVGLIIVGTAVLVAGYFLPDKSS